MTCDNCQKNKATVYLTQIIDGKMKKVNLCDQCSKESNVEDPTGFALADVLLGIGASEDVAPKTSARTCPHCGFSQEDFKKTGRLGCSECYATFSDQLGPMLKNMHKGTAHTGKKPAERGHHVATLRDDLTDAIRREDYETAARLRDEIRSLESPPPARA